MQVLLPKNLVSLLHLGPQVGPLLHRPPLSSSPAETLQTALAFAGQSGPLVTIGERAVDISAHPKL